MREFSNLSGKTILIRIFLILVLLISIPLTVISIKTSKDIKILAAGATLSGESYCSGSKAYIHLWWTVTNSDNRANIVKDSVHITSTYGFTWTSQPEVYNQTHNWQVYGFPSNTISNTKTIATKDCSPPPPPPPIPPPTADIKANGSNGPITIGYNSAATISWGSTNASSCSVSTGGWTGTGGSKSTGRLTSARTYTVSCSGPGGSASDAVTVRVGAPPPPPPPPGPFEALNMEVSVPYLVGKIKVKVEMGGVTKEIEVSSEVKSYPLDLRGANLTTNKEYSLIATSNKTLVKKLNFTPTAAATNINIGDLVLGDINQDNIIDSKDQLLLVDAITKQDLKGDINIDGVTNSIDWAIIITNFEKKGD